MATPSQRITTPQAASRARAQTSSEEPPRPRFMSPAAVHDLHRRAGNQAVQRYTKVTVKEQQKSGHWALGVDLRVADDGNMVVKDTPTTPSGTNAFQDIYTTPGLINTISGVLAHLQSGFVVQQGNNTITGKAPNKAGDRTLHNMELQQQDFHGVDPAMDKHTLQNCNANLWNLQGIYRGAAFTTKHSTAKFKEQVQGQQEHDLGTGNAIDLVQARNAVMKHMTGENDLSKARQQYPELSEKSRGKMAKSIGVNQYATPEIGEGYGIFRGGKGPQYHMAPVIAKSGADTVTLENYAGNPGSVQSPVVALTRPPVNPNWFYRMFGPVKTHTFSADEDQTFWGEHRRIESGEYGDTPIVTTLGSH